MDIDSSQNGESSRCGNPLAQDYLSKIQDGTLVSLGDKNAHQTLVQSRMTGNWKSIKSRVKCVKLILETFFKNLLKSQSKFTF